MAITFRNTRTGRIVEQPEANDVEDDTDKMHIGRIVAKMDASDRWQRVVDTKPARSDPKADWVDYAVDEYDADREQAEESTKQELIETYG